MTHLKPLKPLSSWDALTYVSSKNHILKEQSPPRLGLRVPLPIHHGAELMVTQLVVLGFRSLGRLPDLVVVKLLEGGVHLRLAQSSPGSLGKHIRDNKIVQ